MRHQDYRSGLQGKAQPCCTTNCLDYSKGVQQTFISIHPVGIFSHRDNLLLIDHLIDIFDTPVDIFYPTCRHCKDSPN
jgi:hypothetical protein